jgi:hypothetical protein
MFIFIKASNSKSFYLINKQRNGSGTKNVEKKPIIIRINSEHEMLELQRIYNYYFFPKLR